jgi:hypothetical protein
MDMNKITTEATKYLQAVVHQILHPGTITTVVGTSEAVVCLILAAMLWTNRIGKRQAHRAVVFLVIAGAAGFAYGTSVHLWFHDFTDGIDAGFKGATVSLLGVSFFAAIMIGAACVVAYKVYHDWRAGKGKIKWHTLATGSVLPLLVASVPGVIGTWLMGLTTVAAAIGGAPVGAGFAMH